MDKTHNTIKSHPWWLLLFYHPIIVFTAIVMLRDAWFIDNFAPPHILSDSTGLEFSLRLSGLCCIPLIFSVLVVMWYSSISPDMVNTIQDNLLASSSTDLNIHLNVLQSHLELTFLFVINLLGCSNYIEFHQDRQYALSCYFIFSRFIYWIGYISGVYLNFPALNYPGYASSLLVCFLLCIYNIYQFIKNDLSLQMS